MFTALVYDNGTLEDVTLVNVQPELWVSAELIEIGRTGRSPYVSADDHAVTLRDDHGAEYVWRIGAYDWPTDSYLCRWPD